MSNKCTVACPQHVTVHPDCTLTLCMHKTSNASLMVLLTGRNLSVRAFGPDSRSSDQPDMLAMGRAHSAFGKKRTWPKPSARRDNMAAACSVLQERHESEREGKVWFMFTSEGPNCVCVCVSACYWWANASCMRRMKKNNKT